MNNNTDRTLDVIFSKFRGFSFTITLSYAHTALNDKTEREHVRNSFIVNEKPLNIEKTTSSVLSVLLLIYVYSHKHIIPG